MFRVLLVVVLFFIAPIIFADPPTNIISTPFTATYHTLKSDPLFVIYSFDPSKMLHCTADGPVNISEIYLADFSKRGTLPVFLFDNLYILKTKKNLLDKLYFWANQRGHFRLSTPTDESVTISCQLVDVS